MKIVIGKGESEVYYIPYSKKEKFKAFIKKLRYQREIGKLTDEEVIEKLRRYVKMVIKDQVF